MLAVVERDNNYIEVSDAIDERGRRILLWGNADKVRRADAESQTSDNTNLCRQVSSDAALQLLASHC